MAFLALTNTRVLLGGFELSGTVHGLTLNVSSNLLDATTFSGTSTPTSYTGRIAGLRDTDLTLNGFVTLGSSQGDAILFGDLNVPPNVITIFGNGITVGSTAAGSGYGFQPLVAKYQLGSNVGTVLPYTANAKGASGLSRAVALQDFTGLALSTGTTNSNAYAATWTSTETLYAGLHVTALSTSLGGPSVTAVVQAASSSGFATSTNVVTFTAQTCQAGTWATPVAASTLSLFQPFFRAQIVVSTGSSTGVTANGLVWMGIGS